MLSTRVSRKSTSGSRSFSSTLSKRGTTAPLSEFFPGTPETSKSAPETPITRKTTLDNGLTVITRNTTGYPITNLSLFVEAGARYENKLNAGTSHFISQLGFKDTTKSSELLRVRLLESTGSTVSVSSGRENISYNLEGLSGAVPTVLGDFFEALYPRLHRLDVDAEREAVKDYIEDFSASPDLLVNETLHQVAFGNKNLGNSLVCPPHNISISNKTITEYMNRMYQPNRMTLVAMNYPHDELVDMTRNALGLEKRGENVEKEIPSYLGGYTFMNELRVSHPEEQLRTHVAIGFNGTSYTNKNYATMAVLQSILGNGSTVYQGTSLGSGSHISAAVSNMSSYVKASAFNMNYSDAGLFGIHAIVDPKTAATSVRTLAETISKTASNLTESDINRAKNIAKFNFLASLEKRDVMINALYRQSLVGEVDNDITSQILNQIDSVSVSSVKQVAEQVIKSKVTYVAYGDLSNLPDVRDIETILS